MKNKASLKSAIDQVQEKQKTIELTEGLNQLSQAPKTGLATNLNVSIASTSKFGVAITKQDVG